MDHWGNNPEEFLCGIYATKQGAQQALETIVKKGDQGDIDEYMIDKVEVIN